MALSPLDLQTLFIKMNDVNREQANIKGAAAQEQAFEAKTLVEKEIRKDTSVNPGADESEMDNRIKERNRESAEENEEKREKEKGEKEDEEREYIKDPNLGQHIDLIG